MTKYILHDLFKRKKKDLLYYFPKKECIYRNDVLPKMASSHIREITGDKNRMNSKNGITTT